MFDATVQMLCIQCIGKYEREKKTTVQYGMVWYGIEHSKFPSVHFTCAVGSICASCIDIYYRLKSSRRQSFHRFINIHCAVSSWKMFVSVDIAIAAAAAAIWYVCILFVQ